MRGCFSSRSARFMLNGQFLSLQPYISRTDRTEGSLPSCTGLYTVICTLGLSGKLSFLHRKAAFLSRADATSSVGTSTITMKFWCPTEPQVVTFA